MATESHEATVKDILTDSTSGTGLASKHYAVGLLYVHGIGQQKRGETISEFADDCYGLVQDRIRGIAEGHSNRRTTRETLDKAAPQAAQVPEIRAPRPALRQYLAYLQSAYNFKPEAKLTAEGLAALPALEGEPLLASAQLNALPAADDKAPVTFALELDWTDAHGQQHASDWLIAESWWADKCIPPSIWQLLAWVPRAIPSAIVAHLFPKLEELDRRRYAKLMRVDAKLANKPWFQVQVWLYVAAAILAVVFLLPLVYSLVVAVGVGSLLPAWIKDKAQDIRLLLTRVIGDAFVFTESPTQRATIIDGIQQDLRWLAARCDSIVVVGHSQGAMLAYLACRQRPPNVRTLITLGSGIRKLRALGSTVKGLDQVRRLSVTLLLLANLAGIGILITLGLGLTGRIPALMAIWEALFAAVVAVGFGIFGFAVFAKNALHRQLEDIFWDRRMEAGNSDITDPVQQNAIEKLQLGGEPAPRGYMQWLDFIASHDPVAAGETYGTEQTVFGNEPSVEPPFGRWPRSYFVTNSGSLLLDHTGYLKNRVECIAAIVHQAALLDGTKSHQWLVPDANSFRLLWDDWWWVLGGSRRCWWLRPRPLGTRAPICFARARVVAVASLAELALVLAFLGYMGLRLACALPAAGDLIWNAVGLGWRDLGLGVVLSSAWVAVRAARRYALERLAIEMLERRNWCAHCGADGGLLLTDNKFSECGRLSLNEGAGLAVSVLIPAIVFASVQSVSEPAAFACAVITTAVAHGLGALLRLHQNKVDLRRCYGEGRHGRVRSSPTQ